MRLFLEAHCRRSVFMQDEFEFDQLAVRQTLPKWTYAARGHFGERYAFRRRHDHESLSIRCGDTVPCNGGIAATDVVRAQDQDRSPAQLRDQSRDTIYGSQLMSDQERIQYRARMRELATAEERERFRMEHHELMQARAQERGLRLPPDPPSQRGRAVQPGGNSGIGSGPGPAGPSPAGPGGGGGRGR